VPTFVIKADFPDNWTEFSANTGDVIKWNMFEWKVWDVFCLIRDRKPSEAVTLESSGISRPLLKNIGNTSSCIPILKELREHIKYDELTTETIGKIEDIERRIFSEIKLRKLKGSAMEGIDEKSSQKYSVSPITDKQRRTILRRDQFRCIFCGKGSPETILEVDHIIPRSIVRKLSLDFALNDAEYNLCTTCKGCNREKRDNLFREDIMHYLSLFSQPQHPNHKVLPILKRISELQEI
jgi:hypothetical protein